MSTKEEIINQIHMKYIYLISIPILLIYIPVGILWRTELTGRSYILDIILGSLPNFIGAGLVVPFVLYLIASVFRLDRHSWTALGSVFVSVGFFFIWEYRQIGGSSIFDWNDVVATLLGGMVAYAIFVWIQKRESK